MKTLSGSSTLVIGGGTGVGRAAALLFAREGARVRAVARDPARLEEVRREARAGSVEVSALDARDAGAMRRLLDETEPDLVILSAGARPRTATIDEHSWESFSEHWNSDAKMAFELGQAALQKPLRPGSTVIVVSSGAGLGGSPISGGYAGAKRMQMFLASYLQGVADAKELGIRFVALVPKQLLAGTDIATAKKAVNHRDAVVARADTLIWCASRKRSTNMWDRLGVVRHSARPGARAGSG